MTGKPEYRVATAGLETRDVRLIGTIFRHSRYNRYAFSLLADDEAGLFDILIADPRSPAGLHALGRARSRARGTSVVLIVPDAASTAAASGSRHLLSLERLTLQLLPVLNRVVETAFLEPRTPGDATLRTAVRPAPGTTPPVPAASASALPDRPPPGSRAAKAGGAAETAPPAASNLVTFPRSGEPAPPRVRVLVVDDSPTVRHQLTIALSRMGLVCDAVGSAGEALARLADEHHDLALVDVVMPGVDGYKLTRQMRRRHRGLPVIILTGRSSPFDLARGALAGCDSYLVKPVPLRQLEAAVFKQLRRTLAIADFDRLSEAIARQPANQSAPGPSARASGDRTASPGAGRGPDATGRAG